MVDSLAECNPKNMAPLPKGKSMTKSKLLEMHKIDIVVNALDDAISFFEELGLILESRLKVNGLGV